MKSMKKLIWSACVAAGFSSVLTVPTIGGPAMRVQDAIWADGRLFDTVLTDTSFKSPPAGSTDIIFNFMASGLTGQRSVAEAAPGDSDYNGGRWNVMAVTYTEAGLAFFDPDGDGAVNSELMDAETVLDYAELGYLNIQETGIHFECPLLPNH
jgi:hypothetical protein